MVDAHSIKAVWLCSYPKSGNTWMRSFINALRKEEEEVEINDLHGSMYPRAESFRYYLGYSHKRLSLEATLRQHLVVTERLMKDIIEPPLFIKSHSSYPEKYSFFPKDSLNKVVLIVRNPLSIIASLAHFANISIDKSLEIMCKPSQYGKVKFEDPLDLGSWSSYNESWMKATELPIQIIRYEDMVNDSFATFKNVLRFSGLTYSDQEIKQALYSTQFEKLQSKEAAEGFREKPYREATFFRKGKTDSWKEELNQNQIDKCIDHHGPLMKKLGYL